MTDGTTHDLIGSACAVAAFAVVLYLPGYLLAHALDLFRFRQRSLLERTAWAVSLSFVFVPLAAYLLGTYVGLRPLVWLLVAGTALFVVLQLRQWRARALRPNHRLGLILAVACAWTAFVLLSLVDIQVGHKLYFSVVQFDQSYRVAFTNAVLRTGVPPANPLYFPGHPGAMRYYYFWYVVCALCARIAHVSAQQAFIASSVWTGFGLVAVIHLFVLHFCRSVADIRKHTLIAVGLLAVTGADLVPAIGSLFAQPALNGEMEWWSIDQFYSWQDSILWVPHHTASLLCCLVAFLLLWRTQEAHGTRQQASAIALAGVAFASAFGLSVYVAFGFVLLMLTWVAYLAISWRRNLALIQRLLLAGVFGLLCAAPFLHELLASHSTTEGGGNAQAAHMFTFSVRRMIDPELITTLPTLGALHRAHPILLDQSVRVLLLLPGLALELGVYGVVFVLLLLARRRSPRPDDPAHATSLFLTGTGLLIVLFIRSSVISNNDFAYRASLFPQFFLLLLTADLLASWWLPGVSPCISVTPGRRGTIYALLALGLLGTVYQALMLRLFLPFEATQANNGFVGLPQRLYQLRKALDTLNHTTPVTSVLAFNPVDPSPSTRGDVVPPFTFYARSVLMNTDRQLLSAEPTCASQFGGDSTPCHPIEQSLARLYATPAPSAAGAIEFCHHFGVQFLLASDLDPIWTNPNAWSSTLPLVDAEPHLRIVRCSGEPLPH